MTITIKTKNELRYGSYKIHRIKGTLPTQAITSINLEHAIDADQPNLDFGTTILELIEMDPNRLKDDTIYQKERMNEIKQILADNPKKLCFLGIKGLKNNFRINKNLNEFLIQFQINCGFKLIKVFFRYVKNALIDLQYFRNLVKSKKKTFVACIDENIGHNTFKKLYLECIENKDDIITFFGRVPKPDNADNFNFISSRQNDNIMRFSSSISKSNGDKANSIRYNILGFDCYSFSKKTPSETNFSRLIALDGLYFNTLTKDTKLICVLTNENLYNSSQKFKKNQNYEYLPIYIHDIVRLNELLKKLHMIYTRKKLAQLFIDRVS